MYCKESPGIYLHSGDATSSLTGSVYLAKDMGWKGRLLMTFGLTFQVKG